MSSYIYVSKGLRYVQFDCYINGKDILVHL